MSYTYRHCTIDRIVDGDTVSLSIDLGNRILWKENFRMNGIDTPERGQVGYAEATAHLRGLLSIPLTRVETTKPDKYGRWLVDIWVAPTQGGELHVNKMMVIEGHAKEYFGGAK